MRKALYKLAIVLLFVVPLFFQTNFGSVFADDDKLVTLNKKIEQYQIEINRLKNEANTLSNQVKQFDNQIALTELEIEKTEEEIILLGGRIDELEVSLTSLATAFETRVVETYKMA